MCVREIPVTSLVTSDEAGVNITSSVQVIPCLGCEWNFVYPKVSVHLTEVAWDSGNLVQAKALAKVKAVSLSKVKGDSQDSLEGQDNKIGEAFLELH